MRVYFRYRLDLLRARDQRPCARFQPKSGERRLTQRALGPVPQIGGNGNLARLERSRQRTLELSLGLRGFEGGPIDADPGAAARRLGTNVGRDLAVRPEGQADESVTRAMLRGKDAFPLGAVLGTVPRRDRKSTLLNYSH